MHQCSRCFNIYIGAVLFTTRNLKIKLDRNTEHGSLRNTIWNSEYRLHGIKFSFHLMQWNMVRSFVFLICLQHNKINMLMAFSSQCYFSGHSLHMTWEIISAQPTSNFKRSAMSLLLQLLGSHQIAKGGVQTKVSKYWTLPEVKQRRWEKMDFA